MKKRASWVPIAVVGLALCQASPSARAETPSYSGRYECNEVFQGDAVVSLNFALSVVSHRDQEIAGAKVSLLDASDSGVVYAEFPFLVLSPGVDVPLTASVSLDRAEWDRWTSGAPPRIRLEAFDVDGSDLSAMVEMVQIASPEIVH